LQLRAVAQRVSGRFCQVWLWFKIESEQTPPDNIDPDQVDATFEDGVLRLTLPKTEEAKLKQISVKADHN
jgi:hypothetical protein